MMEREEQPLKVSDIVPSTYVPRIFRVRDFALETAEKLKLDSDKTTALEKYAVANYRASEVINDFKKRVSMIFYPVGKDPIHEPEGSIVVYKEYSANFSAILVNTAFNIFDFYLNNNPQTERAVTEVNDYISVLINNN